MPAQTGVRRGSAGCAAYEIDEAGRPAVDGAVGWEKRAARSVAVADDVERGDGDERDGDPPSAARARPGGDGEDRPARRREEQVARLDRIVVLLREADHLDDEGRERGEGDQPEQAEADVCRGPAPAAEDAEGGRDGERGETAERERVSDEAEEALARHRHAHEPARRQDVDVAEPVAPELGVQLREERVDEIGAVRVEDQRPSGNGEVERSGWLPIISDAARRQVRLERVVPSGR